MLNKNYYETFCNFKVLRDDAKCVRCKVCVNQCSFSSTFFNEDNNIVVNDDTKCVGCQRCAVFCPTNAIEIKFKESPFRANANWSKEHITDLYKQAETGCILLTGAGNDKEYRIYWDHLLFDACQVTNPPIDPLREPMELRTYIGSHSDSLQIEPASGTGYKLSKKFSPHIKLNVPVLFSAMSYGSINLNLQKALAEASKELGICWNTGEGGLHKDLRSFSGNTIVQCASGRFGVDVDYLNFGAAVEIKIGQGAKPGIGGHLPGEKVTYSISETRMIPEGTDAISPAPHHDIYSIEDLRQLIYAIKEAVNYSKPVFVKVSAVHNIAAIASGIAYAGADVIVIDGFRGGTGATPKIIRDHVGIPIALALAAVDERLRKEKLRNKISLIAAGGFRNAADVLKAITLGADAVYIGTPILLAAGCTLCQQCHTGLCAWGITTNNPLLSKRLNPDIVKKRLYNLIRAWSLEIKDVLGSLGINSIESLRGSRIRLRSIGLTAEENAILGVKQAGS
ncbi:MAG TPA: glutamate synthase-related protein [bacterium]|nr:glutamate synthase-related protein [bacterium]